MDDLKFSEAVGQQNFYRSQKKNYYRSQKKNLSELNKMPSLMFSQLSFDTLFSQISKLKLKSSHYADIKNLDQPLIGTCRNILESS